MKFRRSEGTVGVEYELQLVDAETMDLVDAIQPVLQRLGETAYVKAEFVQSMIEVITPVCTGIAGVEVALRRTLRELHSVCEQLGVRICGAGTHPFCRRMATVTPEPRYERIAARSGYIGKTRVTHALQVHVGVASAAEAVATMRDLCGYLPVLLALSASSPFWRAHDTGFASFRQRVLSANRTYGVPPRFGDWSAVEAFFHAGRRAGILESWRDIHWDVRPRADLGTVEIRVMDTTPTLTEACTLAAFTRALVHYLIRTPATHRPVLLPRPLRWWMERENHYQASRLALDARYIANDRGTEIRRLGDVVEVVIDTVAPVAEELGDGRYFEALRSRVMARPSHARQRRVHERSRSHRAVVAALVRELQADLEVGPARPRGARAR